MAVWWGCKSNRISQDSGGSGELSRFSRSHGDLGAEFQLGGETRQVSLRTPQVSVFRFPAGLADSKSEYPAGVLTHSAQIIVQIKLHSMGLTSLKRNRVEHIYM
jgi:hypothetical protein